MRDDSSEKDWEGISDISSKGRRMKESSLRLVIAILMASLLCGCGRNLMLVEEQSSKGIAPPHEFELMPADNATKVSEGVYQVGWIKVFLSDNESHAQMIPVEMKEPYVYWRQWGLEKQDVNFDGYMDIAVCEHGGAKWGRWYWYLYDPEKMEFYTNSLTRELSELTCADFKTDPVAKQIKITLFYGAVLTEYSYEIADGHLRLCGSRRIHAGSHALCIQ